MAHPGFQGLLKFRVAEVGVIVPFGAILTAAWMCPCPLLGGGPRIFSWFLEEQY